MLSLWFIVLFIFCNEKTATKTNSLIVTEEIKLLLTEVALLHSVSHHSHHVTRQVCITPTALFSINTTQAWNPFETQHGFKTHVVCSVVLLNHLLLLSTVIL